MKSKSNALSRAGPAGDRQRIVDADAARQPHHEKDHRDDERDYRQAHRLDVGPGDGLHAAEHRVDDGGHQDQKRRHRDAPAQHDRQHDGRRGRDGAARHRARHQEQPARERPRFQIESALEIFVRGVDPRAIEKRHERDAQDDHRDRQPVIELHEPQTVVVALPRRADQRDGAQLRRHHRQADRPPRHRSIGEEVRLGRAFELGALDAVPDEPRDVGGDHRPIERVHRLRPVVALQPPQAISDSTSTMMTDT